MKNALDLFRDGYDTADIARMTGRHESDILREVTKRRSTSLGKPSPYLHAFLKRRAGVAIKHKKARVA